MQLNIERKLEALSHSKFRSSFHLKEQDKLYLKEKGMNTMKRHAQDFIRTRLAPKRIPNDGRQTPMKGHPVFVAQHATATCCRDCLYKWHHIEKDKELTEQEQDYIVNLILAWLQKELAK